MTIVEAMVTEEEFAKEGESVEDEPTQEELEEAVSVAV